MNKYVLRTSLFWVLLFTIVAAGAVYRARMHRRMASPREGTQLLASGPAIQTPQPRTGPPMPARPMEAPLAPVELSPEQMQSIGLTVGTAEYKQMTDDVRATGTVTIDERLLSYVQVRFPGYIRKVFADATYQYVRRGQPLFTIYSPELLATQQEYLLAEKNKQAMRDSTVDGVAAGAASLEAAAEQRLRQYDIPSAEIANMKATGKAAADLTIESPSSGYITERDALPNMYVEPATHLYTVADLSRVWVNAQVFQNDIGRVRPGDTAAIAVDAYPGRTFPGRVEQVLPQVDMATRTVQVRLAVINPSVQLKPGMFVNVDLTSPSQRQLVVPASAVFQTGTRQLVFLDRGSGSLEPKDVVAGPRVGDEYVIVQGLAAHQRIVTSANFLLDSESQLQAAAGSPEQAGSASTTNPGATIDFTAEPNPPRKGSNTFRVKLTGADGKAVDGADVSVTFYMPAMASMGMAAMRTQTKLTQKSPGMYEGHGNLGSGGTWQVSVVASKAGRTLAAKQLHVNVEGGM